MPNPRPHVKNKSELRQEIRRRKTTLLPDAAPRYAQRAYDLTLATPAFREARVVLLYAALPDEVPTQRLLQADLGKTILLPRVAGHDLELRLYASTDDLVESPDYHIPEPTGPLFTDYAAIDLALIPGMAFDAQGHRLGRGKGFYDRLLAHPALTGLKTIGLCFDFQLLAAIPTEPHDHHVDSLIVVDSANGYPHAT